jgi:type II secretory pathway pseudopilin PulG
MRRVRPQRRRARRSGFTLAEMGVVLVIFGLLTISMLPNYIRSVYRARRTEALFALHSIHDFQRVHYAENGEFSDTFPALGFTLDGGSQRSDGAYVGPYYTYTLSSWELGGRANANYRATATADLDSAARRVHAELIRDRAVESGAAEVLLFDGDHVLQAQWSAGAWRAVSWPQ